MLSLTAAFVLALGSLGWISYSIHAAERDAHAACAQAVPGHPVEEFRRAMRERGLAVREAPGPGKLTLMVDFPAGIAERATCFVTGREGVVIDAGAQLIN